jgi:hypothetical protein
LERDRGICSWYGVVQCKIIDGSREGDADVEAILLQDNRLNGGIPSSIYNLPLLAELNVEGNNSFVTFDNIESASANVSQWRHQSKRVVPLGEIIKIEADGWFYS